MELGLAITLDKNLEEDATAPLIRDKPSLFRSLFSNATETWIHDQQSEGQRVTPTLQKLSYAESSSDENSKNSTSHDKVEDEEEDSIDYCIHDNDSAEVGSDIRTNDDEENYTDSSNSIANDTDPDPQKSIEFEMEVDLHTSWTTIKSPSQSQSSSSFSTLGGSHDVFVRDDNLCWLPARVLEYQCDHALVAISLPETWYDSTIVENDVQVGNGIHSSIKKMTSSEIDIMVSEFGFPANMLRKISYSDYDMGELPKQNIQTTGKLGVITSINKAASDLVDLKELHMATILFNLKERHFFQKPYTRVGDILIGMNPFVWIGELYTPENRDVYSKHLIWNYNPKEKVRSTNMEEQRSNMYDRLGFEPHVYELSSLAYRDLAVTGQDQTILVTGESGAGKTETVKILMDHLASAQFSRPTEYDDDQSNSSNDIVARVIKSSPVFEAFGNAKTARNDNSSRFGKFIRLQFRVEPKVVAIIGDRHVPYADLAGSMVSTYLLEKNRVVFHAEGERTFHIFYQLLSAPSEFKQRLWPFFGQASSDDFLYTAGSSSTMHHDNDLWVQTQNALELFKFRNESLIILMQALGIVLQLGNLVFEHDSTSQHDHSSFISNSDGLNRLSEMMGIDSDDLNETMTSRTLKAPNMEIIRVSLTPEAAKEACDALAKEIYSTIFDVVVKRINEYTLERKESQVDSLFGQISLLDIFGFEYFEINRFEQLCINYCNEKLQGKYVFDNFNKIKSQYIEEGVDLYDFKLVDNSEILDLLEGRNGLITILNEECLRPKGNDEAFVYKAKRAHSGPTSKLISEKLHKRTEFGVNHFAGCVRYNAHSFVMSNMEKLPASLIECAAKSTNSLIQNEFQNLETGKVNCSAEDRLSLRRKKGANKTVLNKFQLQLKSLMSAIQGTRTRYIRCIKPNRSMTPKMTCHASTLRQLGCSGLMTALIIARESYPQNLEYQFIFGRYACLLQNEEDAKIRADIDLKERVHHMLTRWLKPMSKKNTNGSRTMPFACGKTKVFFKAGAQDELERLRRLHYERNARTIQCLFRGFAAIRLASFKKEAVHKIQSFSRMVLMRARFCHQKLSATTITAWVRCRFLANMLRRRRESMVLIQAFFRQWKCRCTFSRMKENAIVTQSVIRMALVKMQLHRHHNAVTLISSWLRGSWCRFIFEQALATTKLQSVVRRFVSKMKFLRVIKAATLIQGVTKQYISHRAAYTESPLGGKQFREEKEGSGRHVQYEKMGSFNVVSSAAQEYTKMIHNPSHTQVAAGDKIIVGSIDISSHNNTASKEMVKKLKARIEELTDINDGLVKEVFKLHQGKVRLPPHHQPTTMQMSSKLSVVEDELNSTCRKCEKNKQMMKIQNSENNKLLADEKRKMRYEIALLKEKHSTKINTLSDELRKTQECHQEYLNKLIVVLETTHKMREEEATKMSRELCAIKEEKNNQILLLHKEVKALRAIKDRAKKSKSLSYTNYKARKEGLLYNIDEEVNNLQYFEGVANNLVNLAARFHNAQQITEMVDFLKQMHKNGAENWILKYKQQLGAMDDIS